MADFVLGSDGYTPAVLTAATRWFLAEAHGLELTMNPDAWATAVAGTLNADWDPFVDQANVWSIGGGGSEAVVQEQLFYKMRGMDAAVNGLYDTWLVEGEPDSDGEQYAGALDTPLRDIVVVDSWSVDVDASGVVVQSVRTESGTTFNVTGTTPLDATIPQSSEGVAYPAMDTTITPRSASTKLRVEVVLPVSASGTTGMTAALFRDANTNALATGFVSIEASGRLRYITMGVTVDSNASTPTTFKLRIGTGGIAGYVNSNGTANLFGGTARSILTVSEVSP